MDPDSNKGRSKITSKLKLKDSEGLLKDTLQVSYNSVLLVLISLIFQIIISRRLGPEQYGELETLLTINAGLIIVLSAICFVITRFISYYKTRQQYDNMRFLAQWAFIFFFMMGITWMIITIIFSKIIAEFLKIQDHTIIIIFGILVGVSFLLPIIEGILRGLQEFKLMGEYKLLDAILKTALAIILLYIGITGFKIQSIIIGLAIGSTIAILFSGHILKKMYINKAHKIKTQEIYMFIWPVFFSCLFFALLGNIDLILVKHFFSSEIAGYYAAAGILAKITVGIAIGVAGVMFPKIIEHNSNGENNKSRATLKKSASIILISGIIITFIIAILPTTITHLVFGQKYNLETILPLYVIAMFFLAPVLILLMYDLAIKKYSFIWMLLVLAFIEIYQINKLHDGIMDVIWTVFVINAMALIFMIIYNKRELFEK